MDFDFSNVVTGLLCGGGSTAVVGMFVKAWLAGVMNEMGDLRREVKALRDEKVAGLERRIDKVEEFHAECPGQTLMEKVNNLLGWTKKIDGVLDIVRTDVTKTAAAFEAQKTWLANLDASHQAHLRDRAIHEVHHG
jgi:predicted translin family RNA/ssDNA-binding protein